MATPDIYNRTKTLYLLKYVHNFFCFVQLVLNATLFSAVLFIIFPKLDIYGSLYFVQKQILGVTILTKTVVATLLVLFGFFASYKKNYVYLTLYGSVMFLIFLLDIALIIIYITFTEFEIFHNYSETQMVYHFSNLDNENSKHLFSSIQQKLQCCGINGPEDYKNGSEVNVPVSCCANNKCKNILSIYLNGCLKTFLNHPVPGLVFVNSVFLILFFIEILSLLITLRYVLKIIDFSKTNVFHPL